MTATDYDREQIRAWIEAATGEGLSVSDPLPDTLAVTGEALGLDPAALRVWVFDHAAGGSGEWSTASLVRWARLHHLDRTQLT